MKVLEALCLGKAVVTTSVGAQGILGPEEVMIIADDPLGFAQATIELMSRPDLRGVLERKAYLKTVQLPTWDEAAGLLETSYEALLAQQPRSTRPVRSSTTTSIPTAADDSPTRMIERRSRLLPPHLGHTPPRE